MFRLLGPVAWDGPGPPVDLGTPKQRAVLAALLADANQLVTWAVLVDRVWDEAPRSDARPVLYTYAARIRRALAYVDGGTAFRLLRRSGGYVLQGDPDLVDVLRFRRLAAAARHADHDAGRSRSLGEAMSLWRGTALADVPGEWAARTREAWQQERLDAAMAWAQAELGLGRPEGVIGPLRELVTEHPLVEPLAAALMAALAATGRGAEALDLYAATRSRLAEGLGTDPGPALQAAHRAILRGDPARPPEQASASEPPVATVRPAQLPAITTLFVGRARELRRLDELLPAETGATGGAVIAAVDGMAGIGKTTLAVHWAHRVSDRFPDGQIYLNLRGFGARGRATGAAEALRGLLDALGSPGERAAGPDALAGLYRSLLVGRRVLVVLDNARDAEQVRTLLPAAGGCMALVTSRNQLTGLIASHGAHPLTLDTLSTLDSRRLVIGRLGPDRASAEPEAVDRIISACARLPLALAVAIARAQQTGFPLAGIAAELDAAGQRLDALDAGDAPSQVRAVFSWSYELLSPPAARLFRLLGLHPGPDVSLTAVASLAGRSRAQSQQLLTMLVRASLLTEPSPGRYASHDLLRTYAEDLAHRHESREALRAATVRLLDHYSHTSYAAATLLSPHREPMPVPPIAPATDVEPDPLTTYEQAMTWFDIEYVVLLAVLDRAVDAGLDRHAYQLTWTLTPFLARRGYWRQRADVSRIALSAAGRMGEPVAQALSYRLLAFTQVLLGQPGEVMTHLNRALELYVRHGDLLGQAGTIQELAVASAQQEDFELALRQAERALSLYEAADHRTGVARTRNAMGYYRARFGDHAGAIQDCQRALDEHRRLGQPFGEAAAWHSLGFAQHHLGQYAEARRSYGNAADIFGQLGDRHKLATMLHHLGDTHEAAGDRAAARDVWERALRILTDLDHPEAEVVRAKLAKPDHPEPTAEPAAVDLSLQVRDTPPRTPTNSR